MKRNIDPNISPNIKLQILIRVLHDSRIIACVQDMEESTDLTTLIIPHFKMSVDIDNLNLYRALNAVFDIHIIDWSKSDHQQFTILLKSEITRKIRKDTALFIDIKLPKKMVLTYIREEQTLVFDKGLNPSSKMARGGLFLGELIEIRALSADEIKSTNGIEFGEYDCGWLWDSMGVEVVGSFFV